MSSSPRTRIAKGAGALTELEAPPTMKDAPRTRFFRTESGCHIIVGHEPARTAPKDIWVPEQTLLLWHLSISHQERYPHWDEIADVRYKLCPEEITMALLLPPPEEYLNVHEHCFHLWQIEDNRHKGW